MKRFITGTLLIALAFSAMAARAEDENADDNDNRDTGIFHVEDREVIRIEMDGMREVIREAIVAARESIHAGRDAVRSSIRSGLWSPGVFHVARSEAGETRPVNESRKAPDDVNIEIENFAGSVTIEGWNKNEIQVEGTLGEDVERLDFNVSGSSAHIEVRVPEGRNRKIKSELTIRVPTGAQLEIETITASIEVEGVTGGDTEIESISGSIKVEDGTGDVDVSSISGSIALDGHYENVEIESISGSITLRGESESVSAESMSARISAHGVTHELDAQTISGGILVEGKGLEDFSAESVSGQIQLEGSLAQDADVDVHTVSGSIRLTLDKPLEGDYYLRSFSGGIESDLGPSPERRRGPGRESDFSHGDGDASVSLESFSGRIVLQTR